MRYATITFLCSIVLLSCKTGVLDEECNPDGTCMGDKLVCVNLNPGSRCKPIEPTHAASRCSGVAECFCLACTEHCDGGFKSCTYSDPTTWGAKPASCECR